MASFRVRRAYRGKRARALLRFLEDHEPASTHALGYVRAVGLQPWLARAWLVSDRTGAVVAAVVVTSPCLGRWECFVALDDPAAADVVAAIIDRAPAVHVAGMAPSLTPVLPHLNRLHSARLATFIEVPYPIPITQQPDHRTRVAALEDLDGLVELFTSYGIGIERTRWQLRSTMRRSLRRRIVVVAEVDGRIVAAVIVTGITRRYIAGDQMVVAPELRRNRLASAVVDHTFSIVNSYRLPACGVMYATNPMDFSDVGTLTDDAWVYAGLFEPRKFRGHARLREFVYRFDALEPNKNALHRPFKQLPFGADYRGPGEGAAD